MFTPELARTFQSDREREIREHVRVRGLVRAAKAHEEHVAARRTAPTLAAWPAADRTASANGGTR
jgi:cytochrome oxidase assembly protein ShyY1